MLKTKPNIVASDKSTCLALSVISSSPYTLMTLLCCSSQILPSAFNVKYAFQKNEAGLHEEG